MLARSVTKSARRTLSSARFYISAWRAKCASACRRSLSSSWTISLPLASDVDEASPRRARIPDRLASTDCSSSLTASSWPYSSTAFISESYRALLLSVSLRRSSAASASSMSYLAAHCALAPPSSRRAALSASTFLPSSQRRFLSSSCSLSRSAPVTFNLRWASSFLFSNLLHCRSAFTLASSAALAA